MPKKIIQIQSESLRRITVGEEVHMNTKLGYVKEIKFVSGECSDNDYFNESYVVSFESNKKTLEVFDVNYVIRDEE